MPSQEDINAQQKLLNTNRRALEHYVMQRDAIGSLNISPAVAQGIDEARANIRQIKGVLRGWNVVVEDLPIDEAASAAPSDRAAVAGAARSRPPMPASRLPWMVAAALLLVLIAMGVRLFQLSSSAGGNDTQTPLRAETQPAADRAAAASPTAATAAAQWPAVFDNVAERKSPAGEELYLFIQKIEVFEDGTSRWHISFWNKSNQDLLFDFQRQYSYIADDLGNQYTISDTDYSLPKYVIPQGARKEYYVEFARLSPKAKEFTVVFENYYGWADFRFKVPLNLQSLPIKS